MRKSKQGLLALSLAVATAINGGCATSNWFGGKPDSMDEAIAQAKADGGGPANDPEFWNKISEPSKPSMSGRISKAFSDAGKALTIEPTVVSAPDPTSLNADTPELSAELMVAAGRVAETQGQTEKALGLYEKALAKEPENLAGLRAMGRHHDRAGDFNKAVSWYQKAVKAHPEEATCYNDLGLCLARHAKLPQSRVAFENAVAKAPKNTLYRNNLATVMVEQGEVQAAYKLLAQNTDDSVASYNIGFLLSQRGRNEEAVAYLKQAVAADPQLKQAESLLASIAPGEVAPAQQMPAETTSLVDSFQMSPTATSLNPSGGQARQYELSSATPSDSVYDNPNIVTNPTFRVAKQPGQASTPVAAEEAPQPRSSYAKYFTNTSAVADQQTLPKPEVGKAATPNAVPAVPVTTNKANSSASIRYASRALGLPVAEPAADVTASATLTPMAPYDAAPYQPAPYADSMRVATLPTGPASSTTVTRLSDVLAPADSAGNGSSSVRSLPDSLPPLRPLPY